MPTTTPRPSLADVLRHLNGQAADAPHRPGRFTQAALYARAQAFLDAGMDVDAKTVEKWFNRREAPRNITSWSSLLLVLAVLEASPAQVDEALAVVGQPRLADLRGVTRREATILSYWHERCCHSAHAAPTEDAATQALRAALSRGTLPPPGDLPRGSRLPFHANRDFRGRDAELLQLAHDLLDSRGVIVCGEGGIGKTQLVSEFAYRYGANFPGGVYFISCGNRDAVESEIAACGGVGYMNLPNFDAWDTADQVAEVQRVWREPIPRLVILDAVDFTDEVEAWLLRLVPNTGGCKVLITSTQMAWSLPALGLRVRPLPPLPSADSVRLLQALAPELNGDLAGQLAETLGGLPLALYMAGTYLNIYQISVQPERYLAELQRNLPPPVRSVSPTEHVLSVEATLRLALDKLNPANADDAATLELLGWVSHLAPGVPVPLDLLLHYRQDSPLPIEVPLRRAAQVGFLRFDRAVVDMHRLVALFLRQQLPQPATLFDALLPMMDPKQPNRDFRWHWIPHMIFLGRQRQTQRDLAAAEWCSLLGSYLLPDRDSRISLSFLEWAAAVAEEQDLPPYRDLCAITYNRLGIIHSNLLEPEQACMYYARALAIRATMRATHLENYAQVLSNLVPPTLSLGRLDKAEAYLREATVIKEQHGYYLGMAYYHWATVCLLRSRGAPTASWLEDALAWGRRALAEEQKKAIPTPSFRQNIWSIYLKLGVIHQARGEVDRAEEYFQLVITQLRSQLPPSSPRIGVMFLRQGLTLAANHMPELARMCLSRAASLLEAAQGAERDRTLALARRHLADLEKG